MKHNYSSKQAERQAREAARDALPIAARQQPLKFVGRLADNIGILNGLGNESFKSVVVALLESGEPGVKEALTALCDRRSLKPYFRKIIAEAILFG